jgi:hypothetical protein
MDLFNPEQNKYGARKSKNLKVASIGKNSYVPSGLTAEQYNSIRQTDQKKKDQNYSKNVGKAFKFLGFDEFYQKRGTNLDQGWVKDVNKGHRMAKTKYDYSGKKQEAKLFESFTSPKIKV